MHRLRVRIINARLSTGHSHPHYRRILQLLVSPMARMRACQCQLDTASAAMPRFGRDSAASTLRGLNAGQGQPGHSGSVATVTSSKTGQHRAQAAGPDLALQIVAQCHLADASQVAIRQ